MNEKKKDCPYLEALKCILSFLWNVFLFVGTAYLVVKYGLSAWLFFLVPLLFVRCSSCKGDKENKNGSKRT